MRLQAKVFKVSILVIQLNRQKIRMLSRILSWIDKFNE